MDTVEFVGGPELKAIASLWVAQKRELTVAFGGTSMLPTIAPGQKVVLRCGATPAVGDVAAFVLGDQLAVHRVVAQGGLRSLDHDLGRRKSVPRQPRGRFSAGGGDHQQR